MKPLEGNTHAIVSNFRTEGVHEWQSGEGETDATCIALALDANTEATLALAFEQRTAALIAFGQWASDSKAPTSPAIDHFDGTRLVETIRDRLGLGDES